MNEYGICADPLHIGCKRPLGRPVALGKSAVRNAGAPCASCRRKRHIAERERAGLPPLREGRGRMDAL